MLVRLPVPPSTNHLFATARNGRRVRSRHYKEWSGLAGWELLRQKPSRVPSPVMLVYWLPFNVRRDASNYIKPLEDLLVEHRIIEGDTMKHVKEFTVKIHNEPEVWIEVERFGQAAEAALERRIQAAGMVA